MARKASDNISDKKKAAASAAERLAEFIKGAVSPYHTVALSARNLEAAGFEKLDMTAEWKLKEGGKYYVIPYKTALFGFVLPQVSEAVSSEDGKEAGIATQTGIHIAAAHTDFPCLHVKPKAEMETRGYMRVNTEVYGGPILNTWLDRPLSLAGRVLLRSEHVYEPREVMVDFARPVLTIPNLAVHYNREVNKGVELTKQNDMLPVLGMLDETLNKDSYFIDFLAKEIGEKKEDILDFDLIVYNAEQPESVGLKGEMLSSPRLYNITSCYALVEGLISASKAEDASQTTCVEEDKSDSVQRINLIALFDNEEIGSGTKQGADSALLKGVLRRIYAACGKSEIELENDIQKGFLLSVDVAHALHPAKGDKYDPVNNMRMGEGVTFKLSANQRYSYDAVAVASLQQLCEKYSIRYKKFVNHADMPGGGTLGPIISSWLPMYTVDIGVPILAMHSARELMGAGDQAELEKLMTAFFAE